MLLGIVPELFPNNYRFLKEKLFHSFRTLNSSKHCVRRTFPLLRGFRWSAGALLEKCPAPIKGRSRAFAENGIHREGYSMNTIQRFNQSESVKVFI